METISKLEKHPNGIMSLDELCKYLKLTKSTIYKLTQRGEIPASRIGKQLRFRRAKIEEWLDKREKASNRRKKNGR